MSEDKLFLM